MCGIAGLLAAPGADLSAIGPMTDILVHRGPDDRGLWADASAGVALGHRRLSIIDRSPSGHQPMASKDGRFVIIYNGEIYNHALLRRELDEQGRGPSAVGAPWAGHSDTETLIECIAAWGLDRTLDKAVGMFAFALWDRSSRVLQLVRDRFGEKPMYYGWVGRSFAFASELKAIRALPEFDNLVDRRALSLFVARSYVPAPLSIHKGIYKLEPGCILTATGDAWRSPIEAPEALSGSGAVRIRPYWSYREVVAQGLADPYSSKEEALEDLETTLSQAVAGQSVADVPVGTFLSGGIDSSTVVGLLQRCSPGQVKTFSIGFEEADYNEAEHAKAVARHFGTDHHEQYVRVAEAREVIPLLPTMYDEPFADSSQIPTYLVSKFARGQVTVAMSGDGGDELFGGYNRHVSVTTLWRRLAQLPGPLRFAVGRGFAAVPPSLWNRGASLVPHGRRPGHFGTKVQKAFSTMASARDLASVYRLFLDEWADEGTPVLGTSGELQYGLFDLELGCAAPDVIKIMYCDGVTFLPDDILCKVDRAAMAVSLETRVPFLDHRVAAVAARVPLEMKVRGGQGKWLLRELLYRLAPRDLFERPKAGFTIPLGAWLRGPLRDWAESLIDEGRLRDEGYFCPAKVRRRWEQHLSGARDAGQALWPLLMFQAWQDCSTSRGLQSEEDHGIAVAG